MTITSVTGAPFAAGTFSAGANANRLVALKGEFDDLNRQLTTGKVAQTYGGLGAGRGAALSARAQIAALDGYDSAIDTAQLRLKVQSASVEQIGKSLTSTRSALSLQSTGSGALGAAATRTSAAQDLSTALDALGQSVGGRYLFAGRATDVDPVADAGTILDGDPSTGAAGLRAVILERRAADLGDTAANPPEKGRLTLGGTGTGVTLTESGDPGVRADFGFVVQGASSSTGAIGATTNPGTAGTPSLDFAQQPVDGDVVRVAVPGADGAAKLVDYTARAGGGTLRPNEFAIGASTAASGANLLAAAGGSVASAQSAAAPGVALTYSAAGTPGSVALSVAAQPADGDTVTVRLGLRDGTQVALTLTARAGAVAGGPAGTFAIGPTTADTAANLRAALGTALDGAAGSDLAAASATLAANDFFAGSKTPAFAARRVSGTPGSGFVNVPETSAAKTVIWYRGDDAPTDGARASAPIQTDRTGVVGTGAQANEPALRSALATFGALAADAFGAGDATDDAHFAALSARLRGAIDAQPDDGGVDAVGASLAQASVALTAAKDNHAAARGVLQTTLSGIEDAPSDKVAAQILQLQTLLQASYQTTSMLAKMSLTNYL